jgi:hypothetical protein
MTDKRDEQAGDRRESCRVNFEISGDFMEEMRKMMAGRRKSEERATSCCGPMPDTRCAPSAQEEKATFVIEIKRKEL